MKNHVAVLALTMASIPVFAGSQIGKVIELDTRADGLIYFVLEGAPTNRPACANGQTYWAIKDENSTGGKIQVSMLIAASISGKEVIVSGSNACARFPNYAEDTNFVTYK